MSDSARVVPPSLAWLDDTPDGVTTEQEFRQFDNNLKLLKSIEEWKNYITSIRPSTRIILIVTGLLGQKIASDFARFPQVVAVYVYCFQKDLHKQWADSIPKVWCMLEFD
jgi:hypothetical protein